MALTDYQIGPDNKVYYQGQPLPDNMQQDPRYRAAAEKNPRYVPPQGTGNAQAQKPTQPGFKYEPPKVPPSRFSPGGGLDSSSPPQPTFPTPPPPTPPPSGGSQFPSGANPKPNPFNPPPAAGPAAAAPAPAGPQVGGDPNTPGTSAWDLYRINEMLIGNGYNGWQVTSATPAGGYEKDQYDSYGDLKPGEQPHYIINIRDPRTNRIKQLTMGRVWQSADGSYTNQDPGDPSQGYGYQLSSVKDQQASDKDNLGWDDMKTIGDKLYGTNKATGVFEPIPNVPPVMKDWSNLRQESDGKGWLRWYGIGPDGKPQQVPDELMPGIPEIKGWGTPYQVTQQNGSKTWYGVNPKTGLPEPIPNMPSEGPGAPTTRQGPGGEYVWDPQSNSYKPAPGIPSTLRPAGATKITLGNDGNLYQQISRGDGEWDPDPSWTPVPLTPGAKATAAATAGMHQPGDTGVKVIGGMSYPVRYRGGGDDNYDVISPEEGGKATPYPGAISPTAITTGDTNEFIAQRKPDGSIEYVRNQNWRPTDPAERVRQLSQAAQAKFDELNGKIGPNYTPDQANADMAQWWTTNVEPATKQIQIDQQKQLVDIQNKAQDQLRQNYATAISAGTDAVNAFTAGNSQFASRVGPNWEASMQAAGKGRLSGPEFDNSTNWQGPDPAELQKNAMMEALKYMSPTAAQATGAPQPNYAGIDVTAGLNQGNYRFGGAPPAPAAPVPTPAPFSGPPAQPVPVPAVPTGAPPPQPIPAVQPMPQAGYPYKPGWKGSDPRLTGQLNPDLFDLYNDPNNPLYSGSMYSYPG